MNFSLVRVFILFWGLHHVVATLRCTTRIIVNTKRAGILPENAAKLPQITNSDEI